MMVLMKERVKEPMTEIDLAEVTVQWKDVEMVSLLENHWVDCLDELMVLMKGRVKAPRMEIDLAVVTVQWKDVEMEF